MSPARPAFRRYEKTGCDVAGLFIDALEAAVATHRGGILRMCRAIFPCLSTSHATVTAPGQKLGATGDGAWSSARKGTRRGDLPLPDHKPCYSHRPWPEAGCNRSRRVIECQESDEEGGSGKKVGEVLVFARKLC